MTQDPNKLRLALVQMPVVSDKRKNLAAAAEGLKQAAGCHLAVLPEMFVCPYNIGQFPDYAETIGSGPAQELLAKSAQQHKIWIVGGSIPERAGGRLYNSSLVYNPDGELTAIHRKVHLFEAQLRPDLAVNEADIVSPGRSATVFSIGTWTIGLAVCFDIRFPEFIRMYAEAGISLLVLPAVFNSITGQAHWRDLLRMRAVDYQIYTAGAAPAQNLQTAYPVWGHSVISDPFGRILAAASAAPEILWGELDKAVIAATKKSLPLPFRPQQSYEINCCDGSAENLPRKKWFVDEN